MQNRNNFDDPDSFFDRVLTGSSNQSQFWARRSFWGSILMASAILVLISVIWLSYIGAPEVSSEDQLPLLRSELNNIRQAPEDRGGMEIPNRDSTVYNVMSDSSDDVPKVENLFARDDEEVLSREEMMAETVDLNNPDAVREAMLKKAAEHAKAVEEENMLERGLFPEPEKGDTTPEETLEYVRSVLDREDTKTIHPVEPVLKEVKEAKKPVSKPKTKPEVKTVAKEVKKSEANAVKSVVAGNRYVQLGSFKSQTAAQDHWAKMKKDFSGVLGGLTLRVQRADLGAKGVYYRAQAGSVSESKAKEICSAINAKRSGSCISVKK